MKKTNIFDKLLVDEGTMLEKLASQVDQASEIFAIEKPSGKIFFKNFGDLSDPQRIVALLVGKYFGGKAGLDVMNALSVSEIAHELGRPKTALSGPLKDLLSKGLIEKLPDRRYRVAYNRLDEIFSEVLSRRAKRRD
jgi:DNA-binding transcriptional ArsR family regulator